MKESREEKVREGTKEDRKTQRGGIARWKERQKRMQIGGVQLREAGMRKRWRQGQVKKKGRRNREVGKQEGREARRSSRDKLQVTQFFLKMNNWTFASN